MNSRIMDVLFRDPVINRLAAGRTATGKGNLPLNLVAKVTALKGEAATLRWQGGVFTAVLNARALPGETLLLEYNGIRKGHSHYRITARLNTAADSVKTTVRESAEPQLFGLMPGTGGEQGAVPALVRFLPPEKQDSKTAEEVDPLLELFVDTENFGLVLIRFYYHNDDRLECRFIVESYQAGRALQLEADSLTAESGAGREEEKPASLRWSVGNLRQVAVEVLHQGGLSLNARA